jgi:hypothetical protein
MRKPPSTVTKRGCHGRGRRILPYSWARFCLEAILRDSIYRNAPLTPASNYAYEAGFRNGIIRGSVRTVFAIAFVVFVVWLMNGLITERPWP